MRRRAFISLIGGTAAALPLAARAQHSTVPVVGFVQGGSSNARRAAAFRHDLNETGHVDGQNVTVAYRWRDAKHDRPPTFMPHLVGGGPVIAPPGRNLSSLAPKTPPATVPIVFGVGEAPVKLGLVASLARPGGNATASIFLATR